MRALPDLAAAGEPGRPRASPTRDLALDAAQHAEEREQQLLLALAVEAAEADDLAAADGDVDAVEAVLPAQAADVEQRRRARRAPGFGGNCASTSRPIISRTISRAGAGALGEGLDVAAVAEDRERVAERLDLVHPVRDEDRGDALAPSARARRRVDGLDVAAGQRRGRLVEDQHRGVAAERLGDLDHLPARQAEVADQRARVDVLARMRASSASARRRWARAVDQAEALGGSESEMLSATVRSGISDSSWKMQTMPARGGLGRVREGDRPAGEAHLAGVGRERRRR